MSDEGNPVQETVEEVETEVVETPKETDAESGNSNSLEEADPQELLKEIQKLRRENAKRRTDSKKLEEEAAEWRKYQESQKTELERLTDRNKELEGALSTYQLEKLQAKIAREQGVDPDLADLITGADEDEMVERAKRLAEKTKPKTATAQDMGAGKNAGSGPSGRSEVSKLFDEIFIR